jgi:5-methyltetrahydropteroyltriglutamate--homocysteine methyltransferase
MSQRSKPPFRADHVGSLLRPENLSDARARAHSGELDQAGLKAIEDETISEAVNMQERIGLQAVTDGEFRRDYWHLDFLSGFDGIELWQAKRAQSFSNEEQPPITRVTAKVKRSRGIFTDHFAFLQSVATQTPKLTIPGPAMAHLRAGREAIDSSVYPDIDEFWSDLVTAYRAEIADLYRLGCRYLQIDDVSFAYLCDDNMRASMRARGDDPDELARLYSRLINDIITDRPGDLSVTTHMCRGNFKSSWVAQGGYEAVAETVFGSLAVDGFFLEYDSERAGGFAPLRYVPDDKIVVLGLVTSKTGELEDRDTIRQRIDEATQHIPLERLCLSPQCGFSSTHHGNQLSREQQWRKLEFIVDTAAAVWG